MFVCSSKLDGSLDIKSFARLDSNGSVFIDLTKTFFGGDFWEREKLFTAQVTEIPFSLVSSG